MAPATVAGSRMSPSTMRSRPLAPARCRLSRLPREKLSRTTISGAPASTSASAIWEPISPAPPVISTRSKVTSRLSLDLPEDAGRVPGDDRAGGHVVRHHAARPDDGVLADLDAAQDGRARSDRRAAADDGRHDFPVAIRLELAGRRHGPGIEVVGEDDAVADKDVIFQLDAFADERVARDLDAAADLGAALDLDKRADSRLVANLAAVEVDELEDRDVLAEPDVGRDRLKLHKAIRRPFARSDRWAASRSATTRLPAAASVSGARCCAIDSANSCATSESASRRSNFGAYMSPVR